MTEIVEKNIAQLYSLIFKNFKFKIKCGELKVLPPTNLSNLEKNDAKLFISQNRDWIIKILEASNVENIEIFSVQELYSKKIPLSSAQNRLWFVEKYEQGSNIYNVPIILELAQTTKIELIVNAIQSIIKRHNILRTLIIEDQQGRAYQFLSDQEVRVNILKLTSKNDLNNQLSKDIQYVYDLSKEYPIRANLYKLDSTNYLSVVVHHIAFDGWSIDLFLDEVNTCYRNQLVDCGDITHGLKRIDIQYMDFAIWQKSYFQHRALSEQRQYWLNKLADYENLHLPIDNPRPAQISYVGDIEKFSFSKSVSDNLRNLSVHLEVSLYSVLLAAYFLLLRIYSNQDDIIIGTPTANRNQQQIQNLIGFFVNSLALRVKVDSKLTVNEFIRQVADEVLTVQLNQDYPFEKIVQDLEAPKDNSKHPIFQIMFSLQSFGKTESSDLWNKYSHADELYKTAKFDISTTLDDSNDKIEGEFNYSISLFSRDSIKGFIETYIQIVSQFSIEFVNRRVSEINYLSAQQYDRIICQWNDTKVSYSNGNLTMSELFENQVSRTPDNIAVIFLDRKLSYYELNNKVNKLANYLQDMGVTRETPVAITYDKSIELVIGLLAIWRAGGVYVPLDLGHPQERLDFILADTCASILITDTKNKQRFNYFQGQIVSYDVDNIPGFDNENLSCINEQGDLIYIMYTSGTTGKPKGVGNTHRGLVNRTLWTVDNYPIDGSDSFLKLAATGFDISVWEMIFPLIVGARLVILDSDFAKDPGHILEIIDQEKITVFHAVPSLLTEILKHEKAKLCSKVKQVVCGGEAITPALRKQFFDIWSDAKLYHAYGPTEASISVTHWDCSSDNTDYENIIPIGKPIANSYAYIVNSDLKPVPVGAIGELYIGGTCLAKGYLNQANLTKERFINNLFHQGKIYKTGDLVRFLPDGNISYLGRNDFQVKIRGHRIELSEIEIQLCSLKSITQSVVLFADSSGAKGKFLVGYYIAEKKLNDTEIESHLRKQLPEYMIPTIFIHLEQLPVTVNGKLDRKKLPKPELGGKKEYVPPRNETEQNVVKIWSELLSLSQDKVGINDEFFKLGGDSILSIQLVSRLRKSLSCNIKVKDIFKYKTIAALYDNILKNQIEDKATFITPLSDINIQNIYPANSLQQGFIFHALNQGDIDDAYRVQQFWDYHTSIDHHKLKKAWEYALQKYSSLRLYFDWQDKLIQIIDEQGKLNWHYIDLSNLDDNDTQRKLVELQEKDQEEVYDLNKVGLFRIYLVKRSENFYHCIFSNHHAIIDGWSMPTLISYVHDTYINLLDDKNIKVNPDNSYEIAQQYLKDHKKESINYWQNYLIDLEEKQDLSVLLSPEAKSKKLQISQHRHITNSKRQNIIINQEEYHNLRTFCQNNGITLNAILQYAWHKTLRLYSNSSQTIVGTVVSGRDIPIDNIESSVGLYINTLPLIVDHSNKQSLSIVEEIQQIQQNISEINTYSDIDLAKLQDAGERLFDSLFVYENYPSSVNQTHYDKLKLELKGGKEKVDYPLEITVDEHKESLLLRLEYAGELFDRNKIGNLINSLTSLVNQIALVNNEQKSDSLNYMPPSEYQKIIYDWNDTEKDYPSDSTIHQLFEQQVVKTPNNIAVTYGNISLTYKELNEKANQLAHYIIKNKWDNNSEMLIAIGMRRSHEMLIAILAVFKAGGAYVSMDPSYPQDRLQYMLDDSKAPILITELFFDEKFTNYQGVKIKIDQWDIIEKEPNKNPDIDVSSNDLAYIIYTSGTTGKPKGVMIEHRGKINHLYAVIEGFNLTESDIVGQTAPPCFDISVWQFIAPLMIGAKVCVFDIELVQDAINFLSAIKKQNVTILQLVPTFIEAMLELFEHGMSKDELDNVKLLITTGEAVSSSLCKKWFKQFSIPLLNAYGPAECSDDLTFYYMDQNTDLRHNIPIGFPVQNLHVYILDDKLRPVPVGVVGEIHVGGDGVARGYLNKEELTKEKFIDNPFASNSDKLKNRNLKLYKSGDLARWIDDGNIEFLGRNDFQVKIRGQRLELSEIESVLSEYPGIKQNIVAVKYRYDSNDAYLVGYYISDQQINSSDVKEYLQEKLPEHMIPSALMQIDEIPLTPNGKIDRKALPEIEIKKKEYIASPRNDLESKICDIWSNVLNTKVGIEDDFFMLGGDSIISIQLVSRLRRNLSISMTVRDIFEHRNIKNLYDNLLKNDKSLQNNSVIKAEQGVLSGDVPLLPVQQYFFANQFTKPSYYNQSFLIKVPKLDPGKLEKALEDLFYYHDVFRLQYSITENAAKQYYDDKLRPEKLKLLDVNLLNQNSCENDLHKILTEWQSEFDIENGPLYSVGYLYNYPDGSSRIYFALHHLAIDTVSWRIIVNDLNNLYSGHKLPEKGSSYRQWSDAVNKYSPNDRNEKDYWHNIMLDYYPEIIDNLACKTENSFEFELDASYTQKLLQDCNSAYNTEINDLLLSALSAALHRVTADGINYIILEGHGREEIEDEIDITGTVGWFTTIYPVRLSATDNIANNIKFTKENLRNIPNKGIGYGALIGYKSLDKLPRIVFNYLGQFDNEVTEDDNWSITSEQAGISMNSTNFEHSLVDINALVIEGKLKVNIDTRIDRDIAAKISKFLKQELIEVIDHTTSIDRAYLTQHDIDQIISSRQLDKLQANAEINSIYLANSLQQGFIYHSLNQGDLDEAYHVHVLWEYHSNIDIDLLRKSWEYAIRKYPSLRLRFSWEEELLQIIDKETQIDWRYIDISTLDINERHARIEQIKVSDKEESYDLEASQLLRIYIIKQKDDLYSCIFSNHHVIIDGWSMPILLNYVHQTYLDLLDNKKVHIISDNAYPESQKYLQVNHHKNIDYWNNYLAKADELADLNILLSEEAIKRGVSLTTYRHILSEGREELIIDGSVYDKVKQVSKKEGVTINAILQYAWHKVVNFYCGGSDTIVGTITSGRNLPVENIESSVGLYINTLPLLVNHRDNNLTVIEKIKHIQSDINELSSRSEIALSQLQKGNDRLFNTLFVYENYPDADLSGLNNKLKINFQGAVEKVDYSLTITVDERKGKIIFGIEYAQELFDQEQIKVIIKTINMLVEQISNDPEQPLNKLQCISNEQEEFILSLNDTDIKYDLEHTLHGVFRLSKEKNFQNIAVIDAEKDRSYVYNTLHKESSLLACYLYQNNPKDAQLIGVLSEKGYNQVVSTLAIMESGYAYLPLHVHWPVARIDQVLTQGRVSILLISKSQYDNLSLQKLLEQKYQLIVIEDILAEFSQDQELQGNLSKINLPAVKPDDLAYVIFTSGSTGKPKGVSISHRGALNTIIAINERFNVTKQDKVFALSELSFDLSVYDLFGILMVGGSIVFPKQKDIHNTTHWLKLVDQHKITIWNTVPQIASLLIDESENSDLSSASLRVFLLSGDWVPLGLQPRILAQCLDAVTMSLGGATEGSIWSIWYEINNVNSSWSSIPYGTAMPNQKMYVLDADLNHCPIGRSGEIHIGGLGVALNYWEDEAKTNSSFIDHPKLGRIYKTGDLGRWNQNGYIEFIGRNDFQEKINGYRVELGEIESAINSISDIKQSIVMLKNTAMRPDRKYLVGYYLSDQELKIDDIINILNSKLPEYMVPPFLIHLNEIPLTSNGKIDRAALPDISLKKSEYQAPSTKTEKALSNIWSEMLNISQTKISIEDDFFQLGGNSILAIKLASKINHYYGTNIRIADIFYNKNIKNMALNIDQIINPKTEQGLEYEF